MSATADEPPPTKTADASSVRQEVDIWWGGYSGAALVPSFAVCVLTTIIIVEVAYYLWDLGLVRDSQARWLSYHFNILLWITLAVFGGYRLASYEYRLTTRRLFCLRGWVLSSPLPVKLTDVKNVRVVQSFVQRWLHVGQVVVEAADRAGPIVFAGVREPHKVAEAIRREIKPPD
jgi:hypothetical protein